MSAWAREELPKIASSDDLHIAPLREDGVTYGTPTWIWSVVVNSEVYVRPYNGSASRWYKAAMSQKAGRITAAGITKEVSFESAEGSINGEIDDAYRTKYKNSPYLQAMISSGARNATIKISSRPGGAAPETPRSAPLRGRIWKGRLQHYRNRCHSWEGDSCLSSVADPTIS